MTDIKCENTMEFFPKMFVFFSRRRAKSFKVPILVNREVILIPKTTLSLPPAFDRKGSAAVFAGSTTGLHDEA